MWGAQQKFDGERTAVRSSSDATVGINKKGQVVSLAQGIVTDIAKTGRSCLVDGEGIGNTLYAFDLLDRDTTDLRNMRYIDRYKALQVFIEENEFQHIELVDLATTTSLKRALFNRVKLAGGEGIVFKKLDSIHEPDRPSSGGNHLKAKFWESATCVVSDHNLGKRSVKLSGFDVDGTKVSIGSVTIPANKNIPYIGAYVEVKYLYYYGKNGSLFQPQFIGIRTDADNSDCCIDQLKIVPEFKKAA